eukprot:TRINITY_DN8481_c0_g1_i2.p1 TRINITY_DN8481_c0_g1~~TRINITY_DN8481_c0_g1_i2.p1  ORF type:complete len:721 (+),score=181.32 TRINITY_DN8481_c0_g1_i2:252-2165(+)
MAYRPSELAASLLQYMTVCITHPDPDVLAVTYYFWYTLGDILNEVQTLEDLPLLPQIQSAYGQLYERLYRATILEDDFDGMLDVNSPDGDVRYQAAELLIDTSFVLSAPVIGQQLLDLAKAGNSWQSKEAALFLFRSVVGKLGFRREKQRVDINTPFVQQGEAVVHELVPMLTSVTSDNPVQMCRTCVHLLGSASHYYADLSDWLAMHPEFVPSAFDFLCRMIRRNELSGTSAIAMMQLTSKARVACQPHFPALLEVVSASSGLGLAQQDLLDLIKGISRVVSSMQGDQSEQAAQQLFGIYVPQLQQMIAQQPSDMETLYDLLQIVATVFRHCNIARSHFKGDGSHPLAQIGPQVCQVVLQVIEQYTTSSSVVEHCNQAIQWCVRCLGESCIDLANNILSVLTAVYDATKDPSCLYVASAMVTVFGSRSEFHDALFGLVDALSRATFALLAQAGGDLDQHPDTVEDIFRLHRRVLTNMPLKYLPSELPAIAVDCATHCITLRQREANEEVAVFLMNLFRAATAGISDDFIQHQDNIAQCVTTLLEQKGEALVQQIMDAITGGLPSYLLPDSAEVLWYLMAINREAVIQWAFAAPAVAAINERNISDTDKSDFANSLTTCTKREDFMDACRHFGRLFN